MLKGSGGTGPRKVDLADLEDPWNRWTEELTAQDRTDVATREGFNI